MPAAKYPSNTKKKQTETVAPQTRARRLRLPAPRLLRLKRVKYPTRLPSVWRISREALGILWRRRGLFLGIAIVYAILSIIFVNGLGGGTDVSNLKQQLGSSFGSGAGQVATDISIFTTLLASNSSTQTAAAGAYQIFLGILVSLAAIWALRQVSAGEHVRIRDAFYKGMYPLVPFILVLFIVLLETLPFLIGGFVYGIVVSFGIALYLGEKLFWGGLFLLLALLSAYMLTSSIIALYVVTLPDMTPLKALRSAKKLVQYRRAAVFRKLLFLPVVLLIVGAVIMMPVILLAVSVAQWVFFALAIISLIVIHAYIYALYRELLA